MRRRKRRFRNTWIAIRASPGGASTRHASRGVVSGRGAHRSEEHSDPGVGANRQPAGSPKGPRLRLDLTLLAVMNGGFALRLIDDSPLEGSGFEPSVPL